MKIGLIDVDSHNFPNIPLMKISAYHKQQGDTVEFYNYFSETPGEYDLVYCSKIFSFTLDFNYYINAKKVIYGGSGYAIKKDENGKEYYIKENDKPLPPEIEHIYPDYSLYPELTKNTAYGFTSRGCPRGCDFCHVKTKEGLKSYKVADLSEFWRGQKKIELCDPNILACPDWLNIFNQLQESKAEVNFNQGLDIRLLTPEKTNELLKIKTKALHFAWDRYEDKKIILPKFEQFRRETEKNWRDLNVYVLCGFNTTFEQDLERIHILKSLGYNPYVMLYDKANQRKELKQLQRWVNNKFIFASCETFSQYKNGDY